MVATVESLSTYTLAELRKEVDLHKMKGYSHLTKKETILFMMNFQHLFQHLRGAGPKKTKKMGRPEKMPIITVTMDYAAMEDGEDHPVRDIVIDGELYDMSLWTDEIYNRAGIKVGTLGKDQEIIPVDEMEPVTGYMAIEDDEERFAKVDADMKIDKVRTRRQQTEENAVYMRNRRRQPNVAQLAFAEQMKKRAATAEPGETVDERELRWFYEEDDAWVQEVREMEEQENMEKEDDDALDLKRREYILSRPKHPDIPIHKTWVTLHPDTGEYMPWDVWIAWRKENQYGPWKPEIEKLTLERDERQRLLGELHLEKGKDKIKHESLVSSMEKMKGLNFNPIGNGEPDKIKKY